MLNAPLRLTSITRSKSSSLMRPSRLSRVTPALFTRTSTHPSSEATSLHTAAHSSALATSHFHARARRPRASTASTVSRAASSLPA